MAKRGRRTTTRKPSVRRETQRRDKDASGVFVPAGLLIGMGIGFLLNQLVPWLFLGLGFGFLAMALIKMVKKR